VDEKVVDAQQVVQVGVRAATPEQLDYAQNKGITVLSTAYICNTSSEETATAIKERLQDAESVYVSLDIDVLDPAFAPGVGNPEGGGITLRKLLEIIQQLKGLKIQAFDVVEANPDYDCTHVTFYSVSKFIRELLGTIAVKKQSANHM
jgi:agmatinase